MSVTRSRRSNRSRFLRASAALAAAWLARPLLAETLAGETLTKAEVQSILDRTAAFARAEGLAATIVVTDREANVLGAIQMKGALANTVLSGGGKKGDGLEGASVPSLFAAISKAGTGSFFETTGNAFTTRTAGYIIQQHFPPTVEKQAGGPLFGVQFSSLPCTDVTIARGASGGFLALGLSADPGGLPLYKNGFPVGGIGVEGDGVYTVDTTPLDEDRPGTPEERAAFFGSAGFHAPAAIQGTEILVNGLRLPYADVDESAVPSSAPATPTDSTVLVPARDAPPSRFKPKTIGGLPVVVLVDDKGNERFPAKAGKSASGLTAADVEKILTQGVATANGTRAAIRRPLGSAAQVSLTVVDTDGTILGLVRTPDAPIFGVDVSAQKSRTAAFFTASTAGIDLLFTGFSRYVDAAAADGIKLDGSVAFSDRGNGFLSRPFFPDGIDGNPNGPFSRPIDEWSVFNDGLQVDLVKDELMRLVTTFNTSGGIVDNTRACTPIAAIPHGIQIFAGSVPLFKNGTFVGAIGVSGDGIDQDDYISSGASAGYEAPNAKRCDRLFVRGVRLPFVKFPRHPNL